MIPFSGENSSKQTIRTKIIRFGYKHFTMCSDDGYPYFIDPNCCEKCAEGNKSKKPDSSFCFRFLIKVFHENR